jgi:hypothetical protein
MSGKQAKKKRAVANKTTKAAKGLAAPQKPELALPTPTLQLDLACGQNCKEGFEGVDVPGIRAYLDGEIERLRTKPERTGAELTQLAHLEKHRPRIKHELDLTKFPWPWADNSVIELHSSHFLEHLPDIYVDAKGNEVPMGTPGAKDLFFAFFDECWRVMAPGAWMTIVVPCLRNNRAFQDPTHRRFYPAESFFYLFKEFRVVNHLDHYNVKCDFIGNIDPTVMMEMNARAPEVQHRMMNENWNAIVDWAVRLKAVKPGPQLAVQPPEPGRTLPTMAQSASAQ